MTEQSPVTSGAPPVQSEPAEGPDAITGWRRMHPITPALKGWRIVVAVVTIVVIQSDNLREAVDLRHGKAWLLVLGVLAVVALVGFAYSSLAWRVTRFAVTDEAVHLRTGVLFRQQRQARLDRLQAVDVVQPLLARLVGLSELKIETAGGDGSGVSLAFLREADAEVLRSELLALAAGLQRPTSVPTASAPISTDVPPAAAVAQAPAPAPFDAAPEREVYELPMGRLIVATLRSGAVPALVLAVAGIVVAVVASRDIGALFYMLPALFAGAAFVWNRVNQGANFRAAISPDGIRLRHGLTENRAQTVPPGRVQAIRLSQTPLWRRKDWWRVEINVAGYGQGSESQRDTVLHPVATRAEAMTALWLVLPDLGVEDPVALVDAALDSTGDDAGFTGAPRSARWVDPIGWRRHGFRVTERALVTRSGRFWRQVDVVPHERTQSLGIEQGVVQRKFGLASFVLHSTPGPVSPRVEHLGAAVAAALLDEQSARARTARATATPEQWMRAVGVPTGTADAPPEPST
ncbi:PH domain-containing protein [Cellulomonas sp. URHD0024]|uniref:PH domain-containing protein n=1 Tax=Cellulomonas sp. URHD0024 TaxID=1302620 RepID=UPI00041449AA|nr:PH domain-containing protein [Cellulomonas sp. URHD0024]